MLSNSVTQLGKGLADEEPSDAEILAELQALRADVHHPTARRLLERRIAALEAQPALDSIARPDPRTRPVPEPQTEAIELTEADPTTVPHCSTCNAAKWYRGSDQKREDVASGRDEPGWRCPACDMGRGSE